MNHDDWHRMEDHHGLQPPRIFSFLNLGAFTCSPVDACLCRSFVHWPVPDTTVGTSAPSHETLDLKRTSSSALDRRRMRSVLYFQVTVQVERNFPTLPIIIRTRTVVLTNVENRRRWGGQPREYCTERDPRPCRPPSHGSKTIVASSP